MRRSELEAEVERLRSVVQRQRVTILAQQLKQEHALATLRGTGWFKEAEAEIERQDAMPSLFEAGK